MDILNSATIWFLILIIAIAIPLFILIYKLIELVNISIMKKKKEVKYLEQKVEEDNK